MSADSSPVETRSPATPHLSQQGAPRLSLPQRRPNHPHSLAERPLYSKQNMAGSVALLNPQAIHAPAPYLQPDVDSEGTSASIASANVTAAAASTAAPPQPQRPKLSLNTAATPRPRSFGRGNTGLRLDTLSAVASPTTRNTFHNTYDSTWSGQSPRPGAPPTSGLVSSPTSLNATTPSSAAAANTNASSSYSSVSSSSSSSSSSTEDRDSSSRVPYTVPITQRSILRNSPIPKSHQVMTSTPTSSTPRARLFPPSRRVTFAPAHTLCQEISTSIYTARHQDLLDAERGDESEQDVGAKSFSSQTPARRSEKSPRSKEVHIDPQLLAPEKVSNDIARIGDKRESSSPDSPVEPGSSNSCSSSDEDDSTCPKTPIAGRAKRRREWVWTLGPIPGASAEP